LSGAGRRTDRDGHDVVEAFASDLLWRVAFSYQQMAAKVRQLASRCVVSSIASPESSISYRRTTAHCQKGQNFPLSVNARFFGIAND
jgi:hypothetical protein